MSEQKKRGPGRPRLEFDLDLVERLAGLDCTLAEIAAGLGCDEDTVTDRVKNDADFSEAVKKGRELGNISLRRKQWKLADTKVGMAIFLGKNRLGQKDRMEHAVDLQAIVRQVMELPDDELDRLADGGSDSPGGPERDDRSDPPSGS